MSKTAETGRTVIGGGIYGNIEIKTKTLTDWIRGAADGDMLHVIKAAPAGRDAATFIQNQRTKEVFVLALGEGSVEEHSNGETPTKK